MSEFSERMKERTMASAHSVLDIVDGLPQTSAGRTIAHQLADSATAVASNYRGTCNARSRREFVAKLGVVVEEADESACWLELIERRSMLPHTQVGPALIEAVEIRNIFGKSLGTARANLRRQSTNQQINRPINQMTK